jgi:hypothetical protein
MTLPVAPELFDVLIQYAEDMKQGKVKAAPSVVSTSPALVFCQNFYAQFFQNRLNTEIKQFTLVAKQSAIRLRLAIKDEGGPSVVIQLITWYEKLCDIYPSVLALDYGVGSKTAFFDFHNNYLLTLLERATAWAQVEQYPDIEKKAQEALLELRQALPSITK